MCPNVVKVAIEHLGTDKDGNILSVASYIDEGDGCCAIYLSLDEIKDIIRKHIRQYIVDLIKVSEI
ncbi:MAG: hypothetical protein A4E42_00228 [Methanoregulaceae archaeon PtaU1.Bin222]|nr:MAG: hypothetical protein A4E42_00228 [Methanoregulaceae archaeon PtaU1.Bin222]